MLQGLEVRNEVAFVSKAKYSFLKVQKTINNL